MYDAFVLAAGLGTRLRPLTDHRPKALVPVCGVPLLAWSLAACHKHGLRRVVVNAHWLAEQVEAWAGEREGVSVDVSTERPEILGTGGGLKRVAARLAPTFVVLNADVLHDVDLTALRAAVPEGGGVLALRPDADRAPGYGIVAADATGTVVRLTTLATSTPAGTVDETTHFTGIHALSRDALDRIPEGPACVVRTAYRALVPERLVAAVRYSGVWLDAGDPEAYLDANLVVLAGGLSLPLDPHARASFARDASGRASGDRLEGVEIRGSVWIGPGARVGVGARLEDCVIGAGATVPAGARLTRVVVWDGTTVTDAALVDAIVHDGGTWRR